jgi:hypothetical protein
LELWCQVADWVKAHDIDFAERDACKDTAGAGFDYESHTAHISYV